MATTAALKTRIQLELNRGDMAAGQEAEQALTDAVDRAIEYWADIKFWFNQTSASASTIAATATVAIPAALRTVTDVAYNGYRLTKVPLARIAHRIEAGIPQAWAENDGVLRIYPIPSGVFALTLYGLAELGTPASAASNAWTTDGLDLIDATARKILYRDYFRDADGVSAAMQAEAEARTKLMRETRRKAISPLMLDTPNPCFR